jgi:hypothetical protein
MLIFILLTYYTLCLQVRLWYDSHSNDIWCKAHQLGRSKAFFPHSSYWEDKVRLHLMYQYLDPLSSSYRKYTKTSPQGVCTSSLCWMSTEAASPYAKQGIPAVNRM